MERLDGPGCVAISDEIARLYRRCFADPPWYETEDDFAAFPAKLARDAGRPGFAAWAERDGRELLGVCFGWPTPTDLPAGPIYEELQRSCGPEAVARMTRDAFEVVELFVDPAAQGRGIGRRLLDAAVDGWPRAWLLTSPRAPAARFYRSLGWRRVGALPERALEVLVLCTDGHPG
ncbi:GNAT family N-acetyltransferase [Nonomuraea sp. MCN248]|uniref:GNAT family N-acetyltransferase n=1 Tax=Nonomuraea corallina TaxID=2989783 RepID=A0ABT4S5C2_9ACTN|nr:GNAT family N-acetyltransferase [Nonomuraea corallina]MDA0632374.1 GNAT family N-acetyltransferase [Nonomuraea corallina]